MQSDFSHSPARAGSGKAAKPTTCRENYLLLYSNPGDVDWFDDEGRRDVVDHWRLLARPAKQGGLRGILFDPEPVHAAVFAVRVRGT